MIYKYKAFRGSEKVRGNIKADNLKEAKEKLKREGLRPIKIEENIESSNSFEYKKKFKNEDLYILFRQLSLFINSGINIENAFEILSSQFAKDKGKILSDIRDSLRSGSDLSDSMKMTRAFPSLVINMVYVGENTSSLGKIFDKLSDYYIKKRKTQSKIIEAMAYPCILLLTSIFIINFLIINVIPSFGEIFSDNNNLLPLPTRVLMGFSNFVYKNYFFIILGILLVVAIAFIYHKKEPRTFHSLLLKSSYYKMTRAMNLSFNMDLLLGSGLTVDRSLEIISNMERNSVLKEKYQEILFKLKSGEPFYKGAQEAGAFSKVLVSMIRVGEESSSLREIFSIMSSYYEEELNSRNQKILGLMGPILIIIMALIIGFIVLSIALPIFDMVNQF
ncbi:MAG: type II secretion system F family protein [Peptoniphilus harei]|uniref:type II secretion system F family protein n=1 Tax=Peptoniphilus harei TaxID=54005 RepID=UPI00254D0D8D|nr:type II secretion system F family protein [Peptoniphilus harei]MDK7755385.1 type II secretion system F family protein [Peptoniphilus harei]MDK7761620.1 type II secretion system F family protein [Peptoniphilus harei]MDK8271145.1 type II secretion system F family protein [Peptoniphilus harei]MDK8339267.1 type II secretion system F family protein [Peptoniphilus harei]MDU7532067.1 type II secretion system F family protein [Peptoniphilus harei]